MNERWKLKKSPMSLDARFDFEEYDALRSFLDELADVADSLDHHPNISFGKTHVSVMIYAKTGDLEQIDYDLVKGIDEGYDKVINNSQES